MKDKKTAFFLSSIIITLGLSAYPIYMGVVAVLDFIKNGYIEAAHYPKYIIPYTPLSLALIFVVGLMPLFYRMLRKYALSISTALGVSVFAVCELALENIKVSGETVKLPLQSWQYSLCRATPEVLRSIGEPIYAQNNPAFKVHFYFIALVILLAVTQTVYGFTKMITEWRYDNKRPLIAQLICVTLFIGLCVLACFTAFFRNGTINVSPLSAILMVFFFVLFGVTFGVYFGCLLYRRGILLSVVLPAVTAAATTLAMYVGELVLMGGVLFRFGTGILFRPVEMIPFALIDIVVILASSVVTAGLMLAISPRDSGGLRV